MVTLYCDACKEPMQGFERDQIWKKREYEYSVFEGRDLCYKCRDEFYQKIRSEMSSHDTYNYDTYIHVYNDIKKAMVQG